MFETAQNRAAQRWLSEFMLNPWDWRSFAASLSSGDLNVENGFRDWRPGFRVGFCEVELSAEELVCGLLALVSGY